MGSFTKIYSRKFHPEESLILTWDSGYKNVQIYDEKRLVHEFPTPGGFMKGVKIKDEQLGEIELVFSTTRPLQLELKVRGKAYKPNKGGKQGVDLTGVTSTFWVLAAFTGFVFVYFMLMNANYVSTTFSRTVTSIIAIIGIIYLSSAILIMRKHYWAFFMGTGYLTVSTLYYLWVFIIVPDMYVLLLLVIIRVAMLIYLYLSIRKVLYAMRIKASKRPMENILDEQF